MIGDEDLYLDRVQLAALLLRVVHAVDSEAHLEAQARLVAKRRDERDQVLAAHVVGVPRGRLMCPPHWRLVPKPMQLRVWRTWEALTPAAHGTPEQRINQIADYRAAADDATAHVRTYHLEPSK